MDVEQKIIYWSQKEVSERRMDIYIIGIYNFFCCSLLSIWKNVSSVKYFSNTPYVVWVISSVV
jgi:hypothetical protein